MRRRQVLGPDLAQRWAAALSRSRSQGLRPCPSPLPRLFSRP
jgi:hypothetical protein